MPDVGQDPIFTPSDTWVQDLRSRLEAGRLLPALQPREWGCSSVGFRFLGSGGLRVILDFLQVPALSVEIEA